MESASSVTISRLPKLLRNSRMDLNSYTRSSQSSQLLSVEVHFTFSMDLVQKNLLDALSKVKYKYIRLVSSQQKVRTLMILVVTVCE